MDQVRRHETRKAETQARTRAAGIESALRAELAECREQATRDRDELLAKRQQVEARCRSLEAEISVLHQQIARDSEARRAAELSAAQATKQHEDLRVEFKQQYANTQSLREALRKQTEL